MECKFSKIKNSSNGYTIIETMIAISLFIIIVMSGMGALVNANLLHQKSESMRSIIDNLSFVLEDMSRNLRTGYNYRCATVSGDLSSGSIQTPKSGTGCASIAFESASGTGSPTDQWIYTGATNAGGQNIGIFKSVDGGATYVQMTPDEVSIDPAASSISVLGAEPPSAGNKQQPLVVIRLVGKITIPGKNVESPFSLQTTVSHRLIDI